MNSAFVDQSCLLVFTKPSFLACLLVVVAHACGGGGGGDSWYWMAGGNVLKFFRSAMRTEKELNSECTFAPVLVSKQTKSFRSTQQSQTPDATSRRQNQDFYYTDPVSCTVLSNDREIR